MECLRIALQYNVTDIHFNLANQDHLEVEMRVNGVIRKLRKQYEISFSAIFCIRLIWMSVIPICRRQGVLKYPLTDILSLCVWRLFRVCI